MSRASQPLVGLPERVGSVRSREPNPSLLLRRKPLPLAPPGDRTLLGALGWAPGTRLEFQENHGLLVVAAAPEAVFSVTAQGFVHVPAVARRWCGLRPGDRVLLVAAPSHDCLVVHPPMGIRSMLAGAYREADGGDQP